MGKLSRYADRDSARRRLAGWPGAVSAPTESGGEDAAEPAVGTTARHVSPAK